MSTFAYISAGNPADIGKLIIDSGYDKRETLLLCSVSLILSSDPQKKI